MKTVITAVLAVLLSGCGLAGPGQAQLSALQQQVNTLSQQVRALKERTAAVGNLDVQSKCAEDAKRAYDEMQKTVTKERWSGYINHYNAKMNRCFILSTSLQSDGATYELLLDANEGVEYASLLKQPLKFTYCDIQPNGELSSNEPESKCQSERDFDRFIASVMGAARHDAKD